nr:ATP synthase F0 subunit 8 [Microheliella maris]BDN85886.1 ATP synthase F0 subunit 8 [Microheliella maris]
MPQLDKVTFLSQFIWLTITFLGLYLILIKVLLPNISQILKLRKKKLEEANSLINTLKDEEKKISEQYDSQIAKSIEFSSVILTKGVNDSNTWFIKSIDEMNRKILYPINENFIKTIAQTSWITYRKVNL